MSGVRRTMPRWGGALVVAAALMSQRMAAADQPVHEVQIVASNMSQ